MLRADHACRCARFAAQSLPRCEYDTSIFYEILSSLRPAGGDAHSARRQPAARGLHRLRHRPLPEPAHRRRLRARVARPHPALPPRDRAAPRLLDDSGRLHGERRDAAGAARRASRSRKHWRRSRSVRCWPSCTCCTPTQVHVMFRARLLDAQIRRRPGEPRGRAVRRSRRFPGTRSRSAASSFALRRYFEDRRAARGAPFQRHHRPLRTEAAPAGAAHCTSAALPACRAAVALAQYAPPRQRRRTRLRRPHCRYRSEQR